MIYRISERHGQVHCEFLVQPPAGAKGTGGTAYLCVRRTQHPSRAIADAMLERFIMKAATDQDRWMAVSIMSPDSGRINGYKTEREARDAIQLGHTAGASRCYLYGPGRGLGDLIAKLGGKPQ